LGRFLREQTLQTEGNRWLAKDAKEISPKSLIRPMMRMQSTEIKNGKKACGYD
jgi:hypothetical protein